MPIKPTSDITGVANALSLPEAEAVTWLLRLEDGAMTADDMAALSDWLEASNDNLAAFAQAEEALLLGTAGVEFVDAPIVQPRRAGKRASNGFFRDPRFKASRAAAALGTLVAGLAAVFLLLPRPDQSQVIPYETAVGQRMEVTLTDGTRLHLNSGTRLEARFGDKARDLVLEKGEVFVEVAPGKTPLSVRAGDQLIRDVGTQFNVARLNSQVRVSVKQGIVDVTTDSNASGTPGKQRLRAGDEMLHREGSNELRLVRIDTDEATAWREGRAVYRDVAIRDVVSDLNRYVKTPVVVDDAVGDMRVSAIIVLDEEDKIVARLTAFLPLEAVRKDGEIRLVPAPRRDARPAAQSSLNPSGV
jgi:transmembrane sensor